MKWPFPILVKNKFAYWTIITVLFLLFNPITIILLFLYGCCGEFTCEAGYEPTWFEETFLDWLPYGS